MDPGHAPTGIHPKAQRIRKAHTQNCIELRPPKHTSHPLEMTLPRDTVEGFFFARL